MQKAAQITERLAAASNGPAYDALAGVGFCSGRAWPCSGAAKVASEMTSFTSLWRMRAHPAGGIAEDASVVMTGGLASPVVHPLFAALQACTDINASTTLTSQQWEPTTYQLNVSTPSQTPSCSKKPH